MEQIKRDLVFGLFLRRGPFWDLIKHVRSEWGVEAETRLPPPSEPQILYPAEQADAPELCLWPLHIERIKGEVVPSPRYALATDWRAFLSACMLFDPPETELLAFADYGGANPEVFKPQSGETGREPEMLAPPVERWPNPYAWASVDRQFYEAVIREIGKRHLQPLGLDVWDMFREEQGVEQRGARFFAQPEAAGYRHPYKAGANGVPLQLSLYPIQGER